MHVAAYYGQTAMVELLIAEGAKIDPRNYDGYSPLRLAAQQGHKDMAELLKRRGGEIYCEHKGKRVGIRGEAAIYLRGTITL